MWSEEHGLEIREKARKTFAQSLANDDRHEGERLGRQALEVIHSAFNWLEDSKYEEDVHAELHEMGRSVRERFPEGCTLFWTEHGYEHRCPVALCHKRIGFSPAMIIRRWTCSICGDDVSECDHLGDHIYVVPGGPGQSGYCPVCIQESCDHSATQSFKVRPTAIITEVERLDEISVVHRPAQPDARLTAIPVDRDRLEAALGPEFRYGAHTVYCSQCLEPCPGFDRLPGDPQLNAGRRPSAAR